MQRNVLEYLEESMRKVPDKIAFADQEKAVTYRQVYKQARKIALQLLQRIGVKGKQPIAVLVDRNVDSLIAMFGVVYAGCFYVPIDCTLPMERIRKIIDVLDPSVILTLEEDTTTEYGTNICALVDLLQQQEEEENELLLEKIRLRTLDTDPLYAIFTSGSTGTPKGVLVSHRSVIDLIDQFQTAFSFNEDSVFGNQAPFDFDVSVKDIYSTLKNGATMHIVPKINFVSPAALIPYLNERKVNTIIWAVSALRIIENFHIFDEILPKYLHTVMFSGEVMPNRVLNYWRRYLPKVMYVNLYGPTEITCNCTYYIVNREFEDGDKLPIGEAFPNTEVFLLDEKNRIPSLYDLGEICVRGSSLALGYYSNAKKTEEAFCQNPLQHNYPEKIYRTGDLGYQDEQGLFYYVCRKDYQIKHMGHRIELGEIESLVNAVPFVEACCCFYNQAKEKIILCYQARKKYDKEILQSLKEQLPKYMYPGKFIQVSSFPINKNGKIDRKELKERYE